MYGFMRSLLATSCCMHPLDCCRKNPLLLYLTLVLPFHILVLRLGNQNLFLSQLDYRPLSRLVRHPLFRLVCQLKNIWLMINLLSWNTVYLFLVYPDEFPRQLNLLELMLMTFPPDYKLNVKSNMPMLPWWIMYLKLLTLLPTRMLKDELNEKRMRTQKLILFWRIKLQTCWPPIQHSFILNSKWKITLRK